MRPAFASEPLANALLMATLVVWLIGELQQALRRRANASKDDRYSLVLLRVCITAGILLAVLALRVSAVYFGYNIVVFSLALLLMWTGMALRWWSFWTLGRYFTFSVMTSADQPVITTGPYLLVRHPSYAGILLSLMGIGLAFGNWLSLAALVALATSGLVYPIRVEESALCLVLGSRYTSYAMRRKRLLPLVW